jgi:hypothetical protein
MTTSSNNSSLNPQTVSISNGIPITYGSPTCNYFTNNGGGINISNSGYIQNPTYYNPNYGYIMQSPTFATSSPMFKALNKYTNSKNKTKKIKNIFQIPVEFTESNFEQRHLFVWRKTNEPWDNDEFLLDNMQTTNNGLLGNLNFYTEKDAVDFMNWWDRYIGFFKETDYRSSIYPKLNKGKINGVFIETLNTDTFNYAAYNGGIVNEDLFNQWVWIVKNTKEGAIQINNGWIFNNEADASLYTLLYK